MYGVLSVFAVASAGLDVQRDTSLQSASLAFFTFMMLLAPITNWEPHGVMLAGYRHAMRHGMKVLIVNPYCVNHLQRYGLTDRGNVTSVYPPLYRYTCVPTFIPLRCISFYKNAH